MFQSVKKSILCNHLLKNNQSQLKNASINLSRYFHQRKIPQTIKYAPIKLKNKQLKLIQKQNQKILHGQYQSRKSIIVLYLIFITLFIFNDHSLILTLKNKIRSIFSKDFLNFVLRFFKFVFHSIEICFKK